MTLFRRAHQTPPRASELTESARELGRGLAGAARERTGELRDSPLGQAVAARTSDLAESARERAGELRDSPLGQAVAARTSDLAETARERSSELSQTVAARSAEWARETVASLDVEWAHGPLANVAREAVGRMVLSPLMDLYTRRRVEGAENLRGLKGPIVFVANHASHMDTPAILRALPRRWRRRTVVAAAADYFYRSRRMALLVSVVFNTVPIERRHGTGERALEAIDRLLERGNSVVVFPEGTRNRGGGIGRLRNGAARLAGRHSATIVPIYINGTRGALPPGRWWPQRRHEGLRPTRHDVTITIGSPIDCPDGDARVTATTERIGRFFEQARDRAATTPRSRRALLRR